MPEKEEMMLLLETYSPCTLDKSISAFCVHKSDSPGTLSTWPFAFCGHKSI